MQAGENGHSIEVTGTSRRCPAGDRAASQARREGKSPVLSCEGACIRGEIARLAANLVAKEEPYRRGCHGELLTVPSSAMAEWIGAANRIVLIDGCFLRCQGRVLENLVASDRLVQFDALSYYRKYGEHFDIDAVPEAERREAARQVADAVLAQLAGAARSAAPGGCGPGTASGRGPGCGCG